MPRAIILLILVSGLAPLGGCAPGSDIGGRDFAGLWSTHGRLVAADVAAIAAGMEAARGGMDNSRAP